MLVTPNIAYVPTAIDVTPNSNSVEASFAVLLNDDFCFTFLYILPETSFVTSITLIAFTASPVSFIPFVE